MFEVLDDIFSSDNNAIDYENYNRLISDYYDNQIQNMMSFEEENNPMLNRLNIKWRLQVLKINDVFAVYWRVNLRSAGNSFRFKILKPLNEYDSSNFELLKVDLDRMDKAQLKLITHLEKERLALNNRVKAISHLAKLFLIQQDNRRIRLGNCD